MVPNSSAFPAWPKQGPTMASNKSRVRMSDMHFSVTHTLHKMARSTCELSVQARRLRLLLVLSVIFERQWYSQNAWCAPPRGRRRWIAACPSSRQDTPRRAMKPAKAGPARHVPNERTSVLMAEWHDRVKQREY